jgi:hypothetical protein
MHTHDIVSHDLLCAGQFSHQLFLYRHCPDVDNIKNFQVNTPTMVRAGLPNQAQFEALELF